MSSLAKQHKTLTMLLVAGCGLLALVIVLELSWLIRPAVGGSMTTAPSRTYLPVLQASIPKAPPLSAYDEMVARPLFTAGRRPVVTTDSGNGDDQRFTLKGVAITNDHREALLTMQGNTKVTVVKAGDCFAGWKVESIEPGHVVMSKAGGLSMVLVLKRVPSETNKGERQGVAPKPVGR
jgi:hypothetical protein